jgi:hypothetical protein
MIRLDPTPGKHICDKQNEVNQFLKDQMLNNFSEQLAFYFPLLCFISFFLLNAKKEYVIHYIR